MGTQHRSRKAALALALAAGALLIGALPAHAAAPQATHAEIAPADQNPFTRAGTVEIVAPASVKRGTTWPLTVNITNVPAQVTGAGPTMIILTDTTGFGGKQILRPVTIAGRTGTVQQKIGKAIPPGTYLMRVFFKDSWTHNESRADQLITVTR